MQGNLGHLLQYWRKARGKSQLLLAIEANVSQRHISFIESGRSNPSREMILMIAKTLDVPLREQNTLLTAAGYAPFFHESAWEAPEMIPARKALSWILKKQEPFPAVAMDRHWNMVSANEAASRFFSLFLNLAEQANPTNILRLIFDPQGVRPFIQNWAEVAEALIQRVYREAVGGVPDETTIKLLEELFAYPEVPQRWRTPDLGAALLPFLPVEFGKADQRFRFFSTVTTLGTPQDITLQEIRIECFFPADETTENRCQLLAQ